MTGRERALFASSGSSLFELTVARWVAALYHIITITKGRSSYYLSYIHDRHTACSLDHVMTVGSRHTSDNS
jgi:hypothetical protein